MEPEPLVQSAHRLVEHAARPCRFCGTPIVLAVLDGGTRMPIDIEPDQAGTVAVRVDGIQAIRARVLRGDRPHLEGDERLHMTHWATCPVPRQTRHRRAGGRRGARPIPGGGVA